MSKDGWDVVGYPSSSAERLSDFFVSLAERGLASFLDEKEAQQYYKELRRRDREWQKKWAMSQIDPERDMGLAFREPDLKNAALYVDLDLTGKILSPIDRVDEQHARMIILGLEWFLEEYANLSSVVSEDPEWHDFANEVRRRLS